MRTTLTIDDDLLAAARSLAHAKSVSVGRILSDLARQGLRTVSRTHGKRVDGFPVFHVSRDAHPITIDDVRKWEDEA